MNFGESGRFHLLGCRLGFAYRTRGDCSASRSVPDDGRLNEGGSVHDANGIASTDENNVLGRLISHSARSEGGIENRRQRDGVINGNSSGGDLGRR